jgi:AcrR family transcriptional regulator
VTKATQFALDVCDWLINNICVSTTGTRQRSTAEERREAVIEAAIDEFGEHGYHAASTGAIAKRAGISQPYIYALFPDKETLFLACYRRGCERIRHAFEQAARGTEPGEARDTAMGAAYLELLRSRRELTLQLQAFAAASDPALRPAIRESFIDVMSDIRRLLGGDRDAAALFTARGMLLNILAALEVPDDFWPTPLAEGAMQTLAARAGRSGSAAATA